MTLYGVLRHLQAFLARIIGTCPTCDSQFPDLRMPTMSSAQVTATSTPGIRILRGSRSDRR
jgi:hypothetical protein